jgi:MFS transporter, DHA2 family, glioxin efflux transporter
VAWYAAAYFMTFGASQCSAGKVYKFFDMKWSFMGSMLIFEVGSLICGVAPSSNTLIVGRAIAGLGASGLSIGATSIISLSVEPAKRPLMMGLIAMTYCISACLGPVLGGVFTDEVSWRWCFYINLPIGGAAAVGVFLFFSLPAAAKPPQISLYQKLLHLDPVGITLAMGSITCFILALQYGGVSHSWGSSVVIGLIVGFVLIAAALAAWELWLGEYAMMAPRLYKQRTLSVVAPFQFFFMGSYIVLLFYLPIYFQSALGASPIRSGVDNLPLVTAAAVFALAGGAFVMTTGLIWQTMMASAGLSTVAVGCIYTFDLHTTTATWVGLQFFIGAVMAFGIMQGVTLAQSAVGPEDLPAVSANLLFFNTLGGAFSSSAGQSAFLNQLLRTLPTSAPSVSPQLVLLTGASELRHVFGPDTLPGVLDAYMTGIRAAFAVSIAFAGVAFLLSFGIPMGRLPTPKQAKAEGKEAPVLGMA